MENQTRFRIAACMIAMLAVATSGAANAQEAAAGGQGTFLAGPEEPTTNAVTPGIHRVRAMMFASILSLRMQLLQLARTANSPLAAFELGEGRRLNDDGREGDGILIASTAGASFLAAKSAEESGGADGWLTNVSAWTSISHGEFENEFPLTRYDSDTMSWSVGADYQLAEEFFLGAFFVYSDTDTNTPFNRGGADASTVSFGPYASYRFNDWLSGDFSVGYTSSDIDNSRTTAAGVRITGEQESRGWFTATNANVTHWIQNWALGGRVGFIFSEARNGSYTDSTNTRILRTQSNLGQLQLEAQARYYVPEIAAGVSALPYVKVAYNNDFDRDKIRTAAGNAQPPNDEDEVALGFGATLFGEGPVSGGIDVSKTFAREDFGAWSLTGRLSYHF